MTILLDECVPRRYVRLLREWGYAVEVSSAHIASEAADADVIALAQSLDAVLMTVDLDFANILDYPPTDYQGIIVLRYRIEEESELDNSLQTALADLYRDKLRKMLVIVSAGRYRLRS